LFFSLRKDDLEELAKYDEHIYEAIERARDNFCDVHTRYDFSYHVYKFP
jgi:hypothetical protein